jgi:hypothetical protein
MRKRNDEYWMKGKIGRKTEGKKGSGIVEEGREIAREEGKEGEEELSEERDWRKKRKKIGRRKCEKRGKRRRGFVRRSE